MRLPWALAFGLVACTALGPAPERADRRDLVVGTGNRLSGAAALVWLGDPDHEVARSIDLLAERTALSGLTLTRAGRERVAGDAPPPAAVLSAWPPADADAPLLAAYRRRGAGVVLFVDVPDAALSDAARASGLGDSGAPAVDLAMDPDWRLAAEGDGLVLGWPDADGVARVVAASEGAPADALVAATLRHAVTRGGAVRHLPTVFERVAAKLEGTTLVMDALPRLPGAVTLGVLTVEGETVVPDAPIAPLDLAAVPDFAGSIVRLRFDGSGARSEERVWLGDLVPAATARLEVWGLGHIGSAEPSLFRVVVVDAADRGVAGCSIEAVLGGESAAAVTDTSGTALLAFPPVSRIGHLDLRVAWRRHGVVVREAQSYLTAVLRRSGTLVQTDRPLYRPGGTVRIRAVVTDQPSGRPRSGERLAVTVSDPRDRAIRTFSGATDSFGAFLCNLPLAARGTEGVYSVSAVAAGAASSRTHFRVEEFVRPPFDVAVTLEDPEPVGGEPVRGRVSVRDWDGTPLASARTGVRLGAEAEPTMLEGGDIAFALDTSGLPAGGTAVLHVHVECAEDVVTREIEVPLRRPSETRTSTPLATVRAGSAFGRFHVRVAAPASARVVDADLVVVGRIAASVAAPLTDGAAEFELAAPPDVRGPGRVVVRVRDGPIATVPVTLDPSRLSVVVAAPDDAAPGREVEATVRVRDADGAPCAALLDVRGLDHAYAQSVEGGIPSLDPRDGQYVGTPVLLGKEQSGSAWQEFEARAQRVAAAPLARAVEAVRAGGAPDGRMPWGAPIVAGMLGGASCVAADGPVTLRLPDGAGLFATRFAAPVERSRVARLPVESLRARARTAVAGRFGTYFNRWLAGHQSPDGRWSPHDFVDLCAGEGCTTGRTRLDTVACTSLALLVYLGAGETHQSGSFRGTVRSGIAWLRGQQGEDGFIGDRAAPAAHLGHALATSALVEAYGMTGARVFREPAQRAVDALIRLQRPDGSFSERGASSPGLLLGTFCAMALKSAHVSDLESARDALGRYAEWIRSRRDASSGCAALGADEAAWHGIGPDAAPWTEAAATLVSAELVGLTARDVGSPLPAEFEPAAARLVDSKSLEAMQECPLGAYLGTLAAFHVGGATWRRWNDAMKVRVIDRQDMDPRRWNRGSWSSPSGGGRLEATLFHSLAMEVYYRYGRVLCVRDEGGGERGARDEVVWAANVRDEFPDLFVADLGARTDASGDASLRLRLPDQVTTWLLDVGAWDAEGRYARQTAPIRSSLPLVATALLPPRLRTGDVVRVPVSVRSHLTADAECALALRVLEGLEVREEPARTLRVAAGASAATFATFVVTHARRACMEVHVTGRGASDAMRVSAEVESARRPVAMTVPVEPDAPVRTEVGGWSDMRAVLRVSGTPLAAATASLAALIRRPHGCFEQTSATLEPALLAWRVLGEKPDDSRASVLREGYQQLLTFEAPEGGFSLYPDLMPRADLTALAIHQLLDLDAAIGVDRDVVERAAFFLAQNLPKTPAERLYALGALRRAGSPATALLPKLGDDPYLVSLALVSGALPRDSQPDALEALRRTAGAWGDRAAIWKSSASGLFRDGPPGMVETTALAVQALSASGRDVDLARRGVETIRRAIGPDGAWSDTRSTVEALRALLAVSSEPATGRVTVRRAGREPSVHVLAADVLEVDLGAWSRDDAILLSFDGAGRPWTTLCVSGTSAQRPAEGAAPLALGVEWPKGPVRRGERRTAVISLANRLDTSVYAPLVVVPLPGGVVVDRARLERAADSAGFPYVEVERGEVRLYGERFWREATFQIELPFTAAWEGTFAVPIASAHAYYEPDTAAWAQPSVLTVSDR